tara:strand:- start:1331 stop:2077 length:747 start_codon:yes stop_codon:yes gene_type:complete
MGLPSVVIGIQCRLSSSRLPGKALLELADTTILGMCLERARFTGYPVFMLTSDQQEDDLIAQSALRYGIDGVIRGSLDNVLSRYVSLAEEVSCDYIIRVTADNPLTEFGFVEPLIRHVSLQGLQYAWVEPSFCPEGTNLEIFSKKALFDSVESDSTKSNLEHVTTYMRRNMSIDKCLKETSLQLFPFDCSDLSFTVDTLCDYVSLVKLISSVFQKLDVCWQSPDFVRVCAKFAHNYPSYNTKGRNHFI